MTGSAQLCVLGAGSILPRAGYGCSGYLLQPRGERATLLDCGPGTLRALGELGLGLNDIERVVLSHFHADHCLDLFAFAFARNSAALQPLAPLELLGPVGLRELLAKGERPPGRWVREPAWTVTEVALDASGRATLERGTQRLACVANGHTSEALSWRLDLAGGASLAYTGDTPPNAAVSELARDVDLFLVECSHADESAVEGHLTPTSAAHMARAARCRRLVLTHFYVGLEPSAARATAAAVFEGEILLARDGAQFSLG